MASRTMRADSAFEASRTSVPVKVIGLEPMMSISISIPIQILFRDCGRGVSYRIFRMIELAPMSMQGLTTAPAFEHQDDRALCEAGEAAYCQNKQHGSGNVEVT